MQPNGSSRLLKRIHRSHTSLFRPLPSLPAHDSRSWGLAVVISPWSRGPHMAYGTSLSRDTRRPSPTPTPTEPTNIPTTSPPPLSSSRPIREASNQPERPLPPPSLPTLDMEKWPLFPQPQPPFIIPHPPLALGQCVGTPGLAGLGVAHIEVWPTGHRGQDDAHLQGWE